MMNDQAELRMLREDLDTLTDLLQKMSEHIMLLDDTTTRLTLEMVNLCSSQN